MIIIVNGERIAKAIAQVGQIISATSRLTCPLNQVQSSPPTTITISISCILKVSMPSPHEFGQLYGLGWLRGLRWILFVVENVAFNLSTEWIFNVLENGKKVLLVVDSLWGFKYNDLELFCILHKLLIVLVNKVWAEVDDMLIFWLLRVHWLPLIEVTTLVHNVVNDDVFFVCKLLFGLENASSLQKGIDCYN
jgi:hypothetical protein